MTILAIMTHMKQLKAILFDNDGTLVDTREIIMESFAYATEKLMGRAVTEDEVLATGSRPLADQMLILCGGDTELAEALTSTYREYNHAIHDERVRAFDGVAEGVQRLHEAGVKMGVVTSKMHWLAWRGLEICGLAPYLDCCIGADDCELHKPDPAPLLLGARVLGVSAADCAYVGDSPLDIRAANAAHMTSIGALWGMFDEDELRAENPDLLFPTFASLTDQ